LMLPVMLKEADVLISQLEQVATSPNNQTDLQSWFMVYYLKYLYITLTLCHHYLEIYFRLVQVTFSCYSVVLSSSCNLSCIQ